MLKAINTKILLAILAALTAMNVYGQAMTSSKREANGKVVEMVLKPVKASA